MANSWDSNRILPFSHLTLTLGTKGTVNVRLIHSFIHHRRCTRRNSIRSIRRNKRIALPLPIVREASFVKTLERGGQRGKIRRIRATNKFVLSFVKVHQGRYRISSHHASFIAHAFVIVKYVSSSPHSSLETCACHVNRILFRNAWGVKRLI